MCASPGKGEFGEVFLAKAKPGEDDGEAVVLVKSLQTRDEQLQTDFRREIEMFAKLSHPNITRLLGLCREAEPYHMILEYADMVSHDLLVSSFLPVLINLFYSVCETLLPQSVKAPFTPMSLSQGDLKQYLKISKSKDEKVKDRPLSTKQKVKR